MPAPPRTVHVAPPPTRTTAPSRASAPPGAVTVHPENLSHWFSQLGAVTTRPPLSGRHEADVAIVGAGFTGLWTAYELKRAAPALQVVVLESQIAGFGASGRNGGWVLGELAGSPRGWDALGGPGSDRAMTCAIRATVDEVGETVAREGIVCDWVKGGTLTVARSPLQWRRLQRERAQRPARAIGRGGTALLGADAVRARVAVDGPVGALFSPHCARVQPARLVRGLADAAERLGVRIYEGSPVRRILPGRVVTDAGEVRARHIVRATEGYTARLPGLRRALLPINSTMIVTERLPESVWAQLGWSGAETMSDAAHVYVYLQRTADGRIAIGGRGVPYRFGSKTDREGPVPRRTVEQLRARLVQLFPLLSDARVVGAWAGVLGVPRDWMPRVSLDQASGIAWAGGYVGEGVAAANLAGRTLCDLLLGRDTELTRLPWVTPPARRWEPEPLRYAGARGIYGLYRLADRMEHRSGRSSPAARLADLVAGR